MSEADAHGVQPIRIFPFAGCLVRVWTRDFLETVFPDGCACPALFVDDYDNRRNAEAWGYRPGPDGVRRMHFEHELLHTYLSEAVGLPFSPVLRKWARGDNAIAWAAIKQSDRHADEARAVEFARMLNGDRRTSTINAWRVCVEGQLTRSTGNLLSEFRTRYNFDEVFR